MVEHLVANENVARSNRVTRLVWYKNKVEFGKRETNLQSFDDWDSMLPYGSRTLLFSSPKVSSREEGLVSL